MLSCNKDVWGSADLEGIFARETLVAVAARERLDGQVNSLMSLQVMIPVEALWALVASERSVVLCIWLLWVVAIQLMHLGCMATIEAWHHAVWHSASNQGKLTVRVCNVGKYWLVHWVAVGPVLGVLLCWL